jgi:acetyl-CoA acetyltransferase
VTGRVRGGTERIPVIVGLGITEMGKVYGKTTAEFAADAVRRAAADAGLSLSDIDGLLVSTGVTGGVGLELQRDLNLRDLGLLSEMQAFGATAGGMLQLASMAVQWGSSDVVACVFADAPLRQDRATAAAYGGRGMGQTGWRGIAAASGVSGANPLYAMAARRHMERYGTTSEQLAEVAVAQRAWAAMNPLAQMRDPITVADHQSSRMIAEPFHLLDCCLVSNGGMAVIVTSAARAADLAAPPVHVLGWAQCHPGRFLMRDDNLGLITGAARSGPKAMAMAGITLDDVDLVELYDCYTFTVVVTLEDYGFCDKGEGGAFVSSGVLGPDGKLKLNTGGGQLSGYYMWGMTPLSEAVMQVRGTAGERQVDSHSVALVSGNGGVFDHHSTIVLGAEAR